MADVKRFSERLIDASERFADVVDAAQGKGSRKSGFGFGARWLVLPAAGAAAYALATSTSNAARRTRRLLSRATDLPDADLIGRVKEVTGVEQQASSSSSGRSRSSNSRSRQRRSGTTTRSRSRRRTSTSSR